MKCLICHKKFVINKKITSLFQEEKYYICCDCYNKYPIALNYQVIPLQASQAKIYSLFKEPYLINYQAFVLEFSMLFNYALRNNKEEYLFVFDVLNINEYSLSIIEVIASLFDNKVVILTNYLRN